jgi:preprotein translocase subunit SecE
MKKQNKRSKKKKNQRRSNPAPKKKPVMTSEMKSPQKVTVKQKAVSPVPKKAVEKKEAGSRSVTTYIGKAGEFLKEARLELKKVKWPTRKELLASTAVVIVLVIMVSFFLGIVDFGLIKIIKNIVG